MIGDANGDTTFVFGYTLFLVWAEKGLFIERLKSKLLETSPLFDLF